jgi:hypothetical protein
MRTLALLLTLLALAWPAGADTAVFEGREFEVSLQRIDNLDYLDADSVLKPLGWYTTRLDQSTIGLCSEDLCVPIEIGNAQKAVEKDGRLLLAVGFLTEVLGVTMERDRVSGRLVFQKSAPAVVQTQVSFPQLQLPQVNGEGEIRNTRDYLLGQRALVFCFASW